MKQYNMILSISVDIAYKRLFFRATNFNIINSFESKLRPSKKKEKEKILISIEKKF